MKIPLSWLRSFIELPDAQSIADRLAALGFPVEHIAVPPVITSVVAGRIDVLAPHPNADRLQVCTIGIGTEKPLTIATAATNVAQGQVVPVAMIGAQLPELTIAPRKMRGIDSEGMLCSAAELGLPAAWFEDGILQLGSEIALGADVVAALGLADPVLEVEVTTNRADALSLLGIARELGAAYERPVHFPPLADIAAAHAPSTVAVELASSDVAGFAAIEISGIPASAVTPLLLRVRLAQAGIRPIHAAVDITNYVMLELGRPLHAFDADALGPAQLTVRDACAGEHLQTLDGVERELDPVNLVVADERGALALAGVFGGAASAVTPKTTRVILECAQFRGARIRRSAAAAGLRTDASSRFEKGLPVSGIMAGAARAVQLFTELGAVAHRPVIAGTVEAPAAAPITLPAGAVKRLLGYDPGLTAARMSLERLGFHVTVAGDALQAVPPPWRTDVSGTADVVEEIARILGYDKLEETTAPVLPPRISSAAYVREREIAEAFCRAGFTETLHLALEGAPVRARFAEAECAPAGGSVEIRNPLSEDQRFLRFSLLPEFCRYLSERALDLRQGELNFFTVGNVFAAGEPPLEMRHVAWISARRAGDDLAATWRDEHFRNGKGRLENILRALLGQNPQSRAAAIAGMHPGKCAAFVIDGGEIAYLGRLDPRLAAAYGLDAEILWGYFDLATLPAKTVNTYIAPSRFPRIMRDLALVLDVDVAAAKITSTIAAADPLVRSTHVFDEYRGAGLDERHKSIAVRIVLQRDDATLTDTEAEAAVKRILAAAEEHCGAQLRR